MRPPLRFVALLGALALLLAACGSSGPAAISDGSYKAYAASDGSVPDATLEIVGASVTISDGGSETAFTMVDGTQEYALCGTDGEGTPKPLDSQAMVGALNLTSPAIYGDCGVTSPERVTVVDLDSATSVDNPAFSRWVEFCNTSDSDC